MGWTACISTTGSQDGLGAADRWTVARPNGRAAGSWNRRAVNIADREFGQSQEPASRQVGMEACATAHYWAREIKKHGHEVRLMAPQYVRPYVKTNKDDTHDAEAICEAVRRPTMRFVAVKSPAQQDVQALHRVRQQLVKEQTALSNQVRGLLAEYGLAIPRGIAALHPALSKIVAEQDNGLSGLMRELVLDLSERLDRTQQRVRWYNQRIVQLLHHDERCQRLAALPGVGPLTATAVVAAVGNARDFRSGRELAAYFGLVPRHRASGGRTVMLGISKRGDCYLRTLLIRGARAAIRNLERRRDPRSMWAGRLKLRRGANIATVALANKNARVMWALLTRGEKYCAAPHPAPMPHRALTARRKSEPGI